MSDTVSPETREWDSDLIAEYIGTDATVRCLADSGDDELAPGVIAHAIAIIGAKEPDTDDYNLALVESAVENLLSWLGDCGIKITTWVHVIDENT